MADRTKNRTWRFSTERPLLMQKCRLAYGRLWKMHFMVRNAGYTSPSVQNWTSSGVSSVIKPALTAASRICACCCPPHPFGCVKIYSMLSPNDSQKTAPLGILSIMNFLAQVKRYPRKSARTSVTVFRGGSAGMWCTSPSGTEMEPGRRWSLNLAGAWIERS